MPQPKMPAHKMPAHKMPAHKMPKGPGGRPKDEMPEMMRKGMGLNRTPAMDAENKGRKYGRPSAPKRMAPPARRKP